MNAPLVSVILPVYNCEKYIKQSIQSILSQTYKNLELIVINDGSTDGTLNTIRSLNDERIVLISQRNMGLPSALNEGLKIARGEFIARQDADDVSLSERIEYELKFLLENPDYGLVGCPANFIYEDNESNKTSPFFK